MSAKDSTQAAKCPQCGHALTGPFCSNCGQRIAATEGWGSAAVEFWDPQTTRGHAGTVWSFIKAPVNTILALTEDPAYRSHWAFLSLCLFTQLTLGFVILPHLLTPYYHVPDIENKSAVLTSQVVQYIGFAILTPIQYYVCRLAGSIKRTPMLYVKLCALSISFGAILNTLATFLFWGIGIGSTAAGAPVDPTIGGGLLTLAVLTGVLVFVTLSHKRFWGMRWWVATLLTILFALLSWVIVYPLVTWAVTASGLAKVLGDLLP